MDIETKKAQLVDLLSKAVEQNSKVTFSTSLSLEDMLLTDVINQHNLPISLFTIDTGRLPPQTYDLMHLLKEQYHIPLAIYFPDACDLENFVNNHGCNAFYQSIDYRKLCCSIRKIGPLKRALSGNDLWITGLRSGQSITRSQMEIFEYDEQFKIHKCNPLLNWSQAEVWSYIKNHHVPYNILHDQGFPSIGCAPCTRRVEAYEDERAGRWWWENPMNRECGLHKA